METDAGVAPARPCATCTQASVACKAHRDSLGSACAYCRRMNKSGCHYDMTGAAPQAGVDAPRVRALEARLAGLEQQQQQLREMVGRRAQRIDRLNRRYAQLSVDHSALQGRHHALAALVAGRDLEARVATLESNRPRATQLTLSDAHVEVGSIGADDTDVDCRHSTSADDAPATR